MSNYTITTDFGAKDSLPSSNSAKVVRGSEFTTEFTNIQTAIATKADTAGDTFTGAVTFDAAVTLNADVTFDTNTLFIDVSENKVGIGTTSPTHKLTVGDANAETTIGVAGNRSQFGFKSDLAVVQGGSGKGIQFNVNNNTFGSGEAMRIDSSGNVGIGTTSPAQALHVAGKIRLESDFPTIEFVDTDNNPDFTISGGNGSISFYDETNNVHRLLVSSSGNVGIGTTSPARALHVTSGNDTVRLESTGSNTKIEMVNTGSTTNEFGFLSNNFFVSPDGTERMRITSSGNVGIGTDSPSLTDGGAGLVTHISDDTRAALRLTTTGGGGDLELRTFGSNGATIFNSANGELRLGTNATERMRIDSTGNVLVGKTDTASTVIGCQLLPNGGIYSVRDGNLAAVFDRKTSDGGLVEFRKDGSGVGSISVTGSATSYNTSSDERLKENIADSADAGSKVDAIQIRQFDWIADGSHQDYGVIAQELVTVAPEAVHQPEDSEEMMGVDYSKLVPMLIKEVQSLRSRVAELENA